LPNCLFLTPQESLGAPKQSVCETHCPQPAPVGHQLNLAHHLPKLTNRKIARQAYNRIFENLIKRFSNSREIKRSGFLLQPFQFENETNPRTARLIRQPMLAIGGESAIAGLRQCSLITGRRRMADPAPAPPDRRRLCNRSASTPGHETGPSGQISIPQASIVRFRSAPEAWTRPVVPEAQIDHWITVGATFEPDASGVPAAVPALASRSLARRSALTEASFCCCSAFRTASRSLSYRRRSSESF
jgi:hypothetical protein